MGWHGPSAPTPPGTALSYFARRNPSEIPSQTQSVSAFLLRSLSDIDRSTAANDLRQLRRSRPEKILNVFQRIRLRFFQACGLASGRTSFTSSRRQCRTGSWPVSNGTPFLRRITLQSMPPLPVSLPLIKNRKATGRLQACRLNASPRSVSYSGSYCPKDLAIFFAPLQEYFEVNRFRLDNGECPYFSPRRPPPHACRHFSPPN